MSETIRCRYCNKEISNKTVKRIKFGCDSPTLAFCPDCHGVIRELYHYPKEELSDSEKREEEKNNQSEKETAGIEGGALQMSDMLE